MKALLKKSLAIILALSMILGCMTVIAFADDECPEGGDHDWVLDEDSSIYPTYYKAGTDVYYCDKCGDFKMEKTALDEFSLLFYFVNGITNEPILKEDFIEYPDEFGFVPENDELDERELMNVYAKQYGGKYFEATLETGEEYDLHLHITTEDYEFRKVITAETLKTPGALSFSRADFFLYPIGMAGQKIVLGEEDLVEKQAVTVHVVDQFDEDVSGCTVKMTAVDPSGKATATTNEDGEAVLNICKSSEYYLEVTTDGHTESIYFTSNPLKDEDITGVVEVKTTRYAFVTKKYESESGVSIYPDVKDEYELNSPYAVSNSDKKDITGYVFDHIDENEPNDPASGTVDGDKTVVLVYKRAEGYVPAPHNIYVTHSFQKKPGESINGEPAADNILYQVKYTIEDVLEGDSVTVPSMFYEMDLDFRIQDVLDAETLAGIDGIENYTRGTWHSAGDYLWPAGGAMKNAPKSDHMEFSMPDGDVHIKYTYGYTLPIYHLYLNYIDYETNEHFKADFDRDNTYTEGEEIDYSDAGSYVFSGYEFYSVDGDTSVHNIMGDETINVYYKKVATPGPGPSDDPTPVTPKDEPTVITEEEPPLADAPEEILEEDVPLADVPETGDNAVIYAGFLALALGLALISRRKEEK